MTAARYYTRRYTRKPRGRAFDDSASCVSFLRGFILVQVVKMLAIETASEACSVALYLDGDIIARWQHVPRAHADLVLQFVDEVLSEGRVTLRDLDGIAFSAGPGAFTGVRIATACAQGLALGANLPVVPVSTLAAVAHGAFRQHAATRVAVALDARMGEVYWGCYGVTGDDLVVVVPDEVVAPARVTWHGRAGRAAPGSWAAAGNGWPIYEALLRAATAGHVGAVCPVLWPRAEDVALLGVRALQRGAGVAPELAQPVYLRDKVTS